MQLILFAKMLVEENTLCDRKFTRPPPTMSSTIVGSVTHQAEMATPQMERRRWRVPITRLPVLKLQQIGKGMTIKISGNIKRRPWTQLGFPPITLGHGYLPRVNENWQKKDKNKKGNNKNTDLKLVRIALHWQTEDCLICNIV